jgi:hypothetical protein
MTDIRERAMVTAHAISQVQSRTARDILQGIRIVAAARYKTLPNWSLVSTVYCVGRAQAVIWCEANGVDPEARVVS